MEKPVVRAWGVYQLLHKSDNYAVKRLVVNPLNSLSMQYHNHREEHWYVVEGSGSVLVNDNPLELSVGSSVNIPVGTWHQLTNTSRTHPLIIVEVQKGIYTEEDDIVRKNFETDNIISFFEYPKQEHEHKTLFEYDPKDIDFG